MNTEATKIALLEQSMAQNTADHLEIKNDVREVKNDIKTIGDKIDEALKCKADKTEVNEAKDQVKELRSNQWAIVLTTLGALAAAIFAIIREYVTRR